MQEGIQEGVDVSKCRTSGLLEESGIVFWGQSLPLKCLKQESDVIALVVSKKNYSGGCMENGYLNNHNIVTD